LNKQRDALVKNASSEKQVKEAKSVEKTYRDVELEDLRKVLNTKAGRNVLWRILSKCKTFETIWHPSAAIHYNSGQQDIGHWLMSEIANTGPESLMVLMKENYKEGELNV